MSASTKLKKSYEKHPVGDDLGEDTILRFKLIYGEIDKIKVKNSLIEVGCEKGYLALSVPEGCLEYVGVDFSLNALKFAKKQRKNNMCYVCADASFLPLRENAFDVILCSEVLEHIPHYVRVLPECFRILKPFGNFLVNVPNRYNPNVFLNLLITKKGIGCQGYDNPPSFSRLLQQLEENSFKIEKFYSFCPFLKLSYIISKVVTKHATSLVLATQKFLANLLSKLTVFPFGLYIFIRMTKDNMRAQMWN